jgi:hypothetical protein
MGARPGRAQVVPSRPPSPGSCTCTRLAYDSAPNPLDLGSSPRPGPDLDLGEPRDEHPASGSSPNRASLLTIRGGQHRPDPHAADSCTPHAYIREIDANLPVWPSVGYRRRACPASVRLGLGPGPGVLERPGRSWRPGLPVAWLGKQRRQVDLMLPPRPEPCRPRR